MSTRNNYSNYRGRNYTDPTPSRYNSKYHQRGGAKNYRPEPTRRPFNGDDVDTLMTSLGRHLTTDGNPPQRSLTAGRTNNYTKGQRPTKGKNNSPIPRTVWWRVTVQKAGTIGKERVMTTLQAGCARPFQPYHYYVETRTKAGVFFVNNQNDADMLKRLNNKVEVQNLDILRIMVCRIPAPVPSLDEDIQPHFKDHLINRRFNQQTFQLDLSNLADDDDLSSLGIFPQFHKQAFIRDVVDIINKNLHMTRILDLGSNNIMNLHEFRNLHLNDLVQINFASNQLKNVDDFDNLQQLPHLAHINIKNNPITLSNKKQTNSTDDIIRSDRTHLFSLWTFTIDRNKTKNMFLN
jgi:hypothetical protein